MAKKLVKIVSAIAATAALYIVGGSLISNYVVPPARVDLTTYFKPGDKLISRYEGFEQTVLAVNDGWLHTRLIALPHAAGPPEHFHEAFTETFSVKSGTLSIIVNGERRTAKAGETVVIPPMTNHKPFNEGDEPVVIESTDERTLPVQFGYLLSQLYGVMDSRPAGPTNIDMLMQFAVYGAEADSYIVGPPLVIQKAMRFAFAPTARLLGYKNHYPEYAPQRAN